MGVVSNKVDITELKKGGGGAGDLPGRVTALEAESVELAEGLALVQTSVRSLDLESVQLAEGLARVQTSVNSGAVPMQTGDKIKFGVDGDGNYGYIKAGADTVTPFLVSNVINTALNTNSNAGTSISFKFTGKRPQYFVYSASGTINISSSSKFFNLLLGKVNDDDTITVYNVRIQNGNSSAPYNGIVSNILTATWDPVTETLTFTGISDYTFTGGLCRIYY